MANKQARSDSKGIRLDVYVEEKGFNRSFDVEIYQGLIDMNKLKRGQHYSKLGKSVIICPFDLFRVRASFLFFL